MNCLYNVPIIPLNLRKEETIIQIAEVLQYLSEVTEDVLKRIHRRIDSDNNELNQISSRIHTASEKISSLAGAKKAIQVFSSSKYPAADVNRQYQSVFAKEHPLEMKRHKVALRSSVCNEEPLDHLQFYHVKTQNTKTVEKNVGLGGIPKDANSINDLLLYNSGKNPYKTYIMSDTLKISHREKETENVGVKDIGAAPVSISEHSTVNKTAKESYFYSPDMGDVPALEVPLDLPDLPGIADDLRFVNKSEPGIAPSAAATPVVPDLPILTADIETPVQVHVPPPPAPSPPPVEDEEVQDEVAPVKEIPPPEPELETEGPKLPLNNHDAHASLMEAIRKAGGLKSANLRPAEAPNEETQLQSTGDLMADLHAKLAMRRKGILGAKNQDGAENAPGSAMDKISAMIPPPPTSSSDKTSEEDEDWDE